MALAIISSIATAGALTPIAIMTLIPLIAIGMNYYRYQAYDPESKIIDVPYVSDAFVTKSNDSFLTLFHSSCSSGDNMTSSWLVPDQREP